VKKQLRQIWTPLRVITRKPVVVLMLLLLCVAVLTVAVQADEVTEEIPFELPDEIAERDKRTDSMEPLIISETSGPTGTNVVVQINAIQDAFLSSRNPNTPYGLWTTLRLGYDQISFEAMRVMLQWDLSSIPSNAIINNATASIYQFSVTPPGDVLRIQGQYVKAQWYESSVTWNNANYLGGDITQVGDVDANLGWKSVNVTDIVRTWTSGARPNYGTILTADETPSSNRSRNFYSRQQPGFMPFVTIDYVISCDNVPPVASVNPLATYNPASFLVTWSGTDYAPSGCTPSGISHYDVQYRANGGSWTAFASHVTFTSQTFEGGQNGVFYEFRAIAVDNAGNAQSWTSTQATTTVDTQPPNASVNPLPEYTNSDNFVLTWAGTDNLSGIKNYDVQFKIDDGPWQLGLQETTLTSYHVTGLQELGGSTLYFRTRATDNVNNLQGWSEHPQAQTTIVLEPVSEILPFEPPILKPTAAITDSFVVRWQGFTAPGTTITSYVVYYQHNGGNWFTMGTYTGAELSFRFSYPNGDGRYGFESVATNSAGQTETRNFQAEEIMIVDIDDAIQPEAYLPIIANNTDID